MIQRISVMLLLIATLLGLAGCNTVQGVGKDLEAAGTAIQKSTR
jgi:predicted small secreted protein